MLLGYYINFFLMRRDVAVFFTIIHFEYDSFQFICFTLLILLLAIFLIKFNFVSGGWHLMGAEFIAIILKIKLIQK